MPPLLLLTIFFLLVWLVLALTGFLAVRAQGRVTRKHLQRPSKPLSPPDPLDDYQPRSLEREWAEQVLARGLAEQAEQERLAAIAACDHDDVESIEITAFLSGWTREYLCHCRTCGASDQDMKRADITWIT